MNDGWIQQCSTMKDSELLQWIFDRLNCVYGESENRDYMIRLKQIQKEVERHEK